MASVNRMLRFPSFFFFFLLNNSVATFIYNNTRYSFVIDDWIRENRRYLNASIYIQKYVSISLKSLINIESHGIFGDKETINWRRRARDRICNPLESFLDTHLSRSLLYFSRRQSRSLENFVRPMLVRPRKILPLPPLSISLSLSRKWLPHEDNASLHFAH